MRNINSTSRETMVKSELVSNPRKVNADFPADMLPKRNKGNRRKNRTSLVHFNAVKHVYNDILQGATESIVVNKLVDDFYEIGKKYSRDHALHILQEGKSLIMEDMEKELQDIRINLMAKAYDTYTDAREQGDRTNALKALDFISKITGALDPKYGQTNVQNITIDFRFGDDDNKETDYEDVDEC